MNSDSDMSMHSDCGVDCAAYVLGALDAREATAFEQHLQSCSVCVAEVESLRHTVNALPMAAPQYPASRHLRRRVMRAVREEARPQPLAAPARDLTARLGFARGTVPRHGSGASFRPGLVSAMTALVLVVVVVVVGITASGTSHRDRRGSATDRAGGAQVVEASTGAAEVIERNGRGELIVHKLGRLTGGQVYEVWLERRGGSPQPTTTLFNTDADGEGDVVVSAPLKGYHTLMVTREPAGGTAVPTHDAVVVATL